MQREGAADQRHLAAREANINQPTHPSGNIHSVYRSFHKVIYPSILLTSPVSDLPVNEGFMFMCLHLRFRV